VTWVYVGRMGIPPSTWQERREEGFTKCGFSSAETSVVGSLHTFVCTRKGEHSGTHVADGLDRMVAYWDPTWVPPGKGEQTPAAELE